MFPSPPPRPAPAAHHSCCLVLLQEGSQDRAGGLGENRERGEAEASEGVWPSRKAPFSHIHRKAGAGDSPTLSKEQSWVPWLAALGNSALFPPSWSFVPVPQPDSGTHSRLSVEMPRAPAPESLVKKT